VWKQLFELLRGTMLLARDVGELRKEFDPFPKRISAAINRFSSYISDPMFLT
jgi:hypothetical protein